MQPSSLNNIGPNETDSRPSVSVVIPVYNASEYIAATLDSVFRQTFSDYEVIVVNDGSSDTPILESVLSPYLARIRYFRQENRGPSAARNLGIREGRGTYIALLDSDDLWFPEHLSRQMASLRQSQSPSLVYSNAVHIWGAEARGSAFDIVPQIGSVTLESLLAERCTVNTSSVVVPRDAVLQAGLFDETMNRCEDYDLWLRLAAQGVGMTYNREVQVVHRLCDGLSGNTLLMKEGRSAVYRKALNTLPLTVAQRDIVLGKLRDLAVEIELEAAREHLAAGRFDEARAEVRRAGRTANRIRYRIVGALLYCFPRMVRWFYSVYIRGLMWYKRRAAQLAGEKVQEDATVLAMLNAARAVSKGGSSGEVNVRKATLGCDRI